MSTATATKHSATKKPAVAGQKKPRNGLSISALAERFELDWKTVKHRLRGVSPAWSESRLKLYLLSDKNKQGQSVQKLLEEELVDPQLEEAKRRKMTAEARLKEMQADIEEGRLIAVTAVREEMVDFCKELNHRLCKNYPREAADRLQRADSKKQVREILQHDMVILLDNLIADYAAIIAGNEKNGGRDVRTATAGRGAPRAAVTKS